MSRDPSADRDCGLQPFISRREMIALCAGIAAGGFAEANAQTLRRKTPARPNILVYLSDTLRADHLSCYGYAVQTSPYFDKTAGEWFIFEKCRAHATWTKPSIASIYTGVSPCVHKVSTGTMQINGMEMSQMLPANIRTLAESLEQDGGYDTGLFLSNGIVSQELGFARGFVHYHYNQLEEAAVQRVAVERWIEKSATKPFFAFVHQMDPHGPYSPRDDDFESLFGGSRQTAFANLTSEDRAVLDAYYGFYDQPTAKSIPDRQKNLRRLSRQGLQFLKNVYDAEILHVVREFARLVDFLKSTGLLDNTVVVFTSDHGEAFNEHGFFLHGYEPVEEQIRVPLLIRCPGAARGARVANPVGHVDLTATLLSMAGLQPLPLARGQVLISNSGELNSPEARPQMAWTINRTNLADSEASMVLRDYKLISYQSCRKFLYYNLVADPGETRDLCAAGIDLQKTPYAEMVERLLREKAAQLALAESVDEPGWWAADQEHIEQLKALGYV